MAEAKTDKKCPNNHRIPSSESIVQLLSVKASDVCNVYIVGSHLWGTCSKHSDWDVVVIVRHSDHDKPLNVHKANVDGWILSTEQYIAVISDHLLQALVTLWIPPQLVLMENFNPRAHFKLDQHQLLTSANKMYERDSRVAQKHFSKDSAGAGIRVMRHCVRQLQLAVQIRGNGRITDYNTVSEDSVEWTVLQYTCTSWTDLTDAIHPVIDPLLQRLH